MGDVPFSVLYHKQNKHHIKIWSFDGYICKVRCNLNVVKVSTGGLMQRIAFEDEMEAE